MSIILIIIGCIGVFILFLIIMSTTKSGSFLKIYYMLVSFCSLMGLVIAGGICTYEVISYNLISLEEYASNRREYTSCTDPNYAVKTETGEETQPKTQEEITTCQAEALVKVETSRSYDHKTTLINSGLRTGIFLILFCIHFPLFLRTNKKPE